MKSLFKPIKKQKPNLFLAIAILILCILSLCGISADTRVNAEGLQEEKAEEGYEELSDSVQDQIENLDLEDLQAYLNTLEGFKGKNVKESLLEYVQGGKMDYGSFFEGLLRVFFSKIAEIMPAFACITAIALLSGLLSMLKSSAAGNTASEMIFLITYAAALIPLIAVLIECFQETFEGVSSMTRQMQAVFPLMLTLLSASGSSVSAAICRPAVGFFSTTIVTIIETVVLPLTVTMMAFSMAGNLTKELKIGKFTAFFKSINKWILGVCASVFGLFFTVQGITSATYDGVVRRAAKYAIGNGVPIVGGFLSGGFDLVVAGSVLIKNSLGSMSIFMMISVLFEPLILLICVTFMLRLVAATTQPFGDSRISDFLGETADNLQYCTAGLLITAFLYFLSIVLMVCCTEALF
ncbi:MAG: hypothetical protein E7380_06115 [Clostridiales bacterium]|nr:hypothetical protein [Clostridiales bacterium]